MMIRGNISAGMPLVSQLTIVMHTRAAEISNELSTFVNPSRAVEGRAIRLSFVSCVKCVELDAGGTIVHITGL